MRTRADTGDVLAFWQPRSPLGLRDCDARQIKANIAGFFRVLLDWVRIPSDGDQRSEVMAITIPN